MVTVDLARAVSLLFRVTLGTIAALSFAHLWVLTFGTRVQSTTARGLILVFDLEQETAIPTFFSALLLLAAGLAAAGAAALAWRRMRRLALGWLLFSLCLIFAAIDEAAAIHDRLAGPLQMALRTGGPFFIGWTIPYLLLVATALAVVVPLLRQLDRTTLRRLAVAASLYIVSALGLEMIEAAVLEEAAGQGATFYQAKSVVAEGGDPLAWTVLVMLEEVGEMLAAALALRAILLHLVFVQGLRVLTLEPRRSEAHASARELVRAGEGQDGPVLQLVPVEQRAKQRS